MEKWKMNHHPTLKHDDVNSSSGGRLMTATEVALRLNVRSAKRVYELPIPFVQLSERSKRWLEADVENFIQGRKRGIAA
jgi:hypothetical protein